MVAKNFAAAKFSPRVRGEFAEQFVSWKSALRRINVDSTTHGVSRHSTATSSLFPNLAQDIHLLLREEHQVNGRTVVLSQSLYIVGIRGPVVGCSLALYAVGRGSIPGRVIPKT